MNNNIFSGAGLRVDTIVQDAFNNSNIISLDESVLEILSKVDTKVDLGYIHSIEDDIQDRIDAIEESHFELLSRFEKENKELRKIIANLNTRVNNLIAEKQVKEFYEKNSSN